MNTTRSTHCLFSFTHVCDFCRNLSPIIFLPLQMRNSKPKFYCLSMHLFYFHVCFLFLFLFKREMKIPRNNFYTTTVWVSGLLNCLFLAPSDGFFFLVRFSFLKAKRSRKINACLIGKCLFFFHAHAIFLYE